MGAVFLAKQIAVGNRPVALKVLNRKLLDDPEFLLRFQNEAASTGRIHHSNVVTIYESGQADDGTPYIAMEFLEGESLRQALKRVGALPVEECAEILMQVARGLNAAHKLGIIHRDLKPDNIFLTRGDEDERMIKVVDFGIAKLRESATHTLTGTVLGTPAYMSSEQASGLPSDQLDARSDIYSLGIVIYEMLSGRVPFYSTTPLGFLRKHMLDDPPPFRAVAPGLSVSPQVEAVVMKALKKEREERYPSALEFARAFAAAAQPASAPEVSQTLPSTKVVASPAAREPAAPMPRSASTRALADTAVQTPPPARPGIIGETQSAQPEGSRLVGAASRLPAASPQLKAVQPAAKGPTKEPWAPKPREFHKSTRAGFWWVAGLLTVLLTAGGAWLYRTKIEKGTVNISAPVQQAPTIAPSTEVGSAQKGAPPVEREGKPTTPSSGPPAKEASIRSDSKGKVGSPAVSQRPGAQEGRPRKLSAEELAAQVLPMLVQAKTAMDGGKYDDAIADYRKALQLDPNNSAAREGLARAQKAQAAEGELK
jgi:serine/threonine-protein kinase